MTFRTINERAVQAVGWLAAAPVLMLIAVLVYRGAAAFPLILNPHDFTVWAPAPPEKDFGILPLVSGTLCVGVLALTLAWPPAILVAIRLALFAKDRERRFFQIVFGTLNSMPTIVLGLLGIIWIIPVVGHSVLAAGTVLALLAWPAIALPSGEALRTETCSLVETAHSLGLGPWTTARLLLAARRKALVSVAALPFARVLGEAVAVSLVAGNKAKPFPGLLDTTKTLASAVAGDWNVDDGLNRASIFAAALCVVLIVGGVMAMRGWLQARSTAKGGANV